MTTGPINNDTPSKQQKWSMLLAWPTDVPGRVQARPTGRPGGVAGRERGRGHRNLAPGGPDRPGRLDPATGMQEGQVLHSLKL